MKKILFSVILYLALIVNAPAMTLSEFESLSETEAKTKAKEELFKDYSNAAMVNIQLDKEIDSFRKLKNMYSSMSDEEKKILERLLKDYDYSFCTVLILYESALEDRKAPKEDDKWKG